MFEKRFAHGRKSSDISSFMDILLRLVKYISHHIGISSGPVRNQFIDAFIRNILRDRTVYPEFRMIEKFRSEVYGNNIRLDFPDPGAGTRSCRRSGTIGGMAKTASVKAKYGRLLYSLARYYQPGQIIELGTGAGLSTLYMAYGNPQAGIITIEGNPQLAALASGNFTAAGLQQVTVINDSFDNVISQTFSPLKSDTLVFIDGNHTFDATLRYYRVLGNVSGFRCILVLDDINWSDQMMRAWRAIADMEHSGYIIDLYKLGVIFKGYGGKQQKFRLRY